MNICTNTLRKGDNYDDNNNNNHHPKLHSSDGESEPRTYGQHARNQKTINKAVFNPISYQLSYPYPANV
jgi:hypothetical protein